MLEHSLTLQLLTTGPAENTTSRLRQEYQALQRLFQAQPASQQDEVRNQAAIIADGLLYGKGSIRFTLPDTVTCLLLMDCADVVEKIPLRARNQQVGGLLDRLTRRDRVMALEHQLTALEKSANPGIAVGAGLLRYAVAVHMIYHLLPKGHPVVYATMDDEEIPNQPVIRQNVARYDRSSTSCDELESDVLIARSLTSQPAGWADSFYLPQYVAFDDQNQLMAGDLGEATARIQAMQHYLLALNSAVTLAPYIVVDDEFQARRYGILGQLVNQGRAYASYQVEMICQKIKQRADSHKLDRGFSLSIPFFNDQTLSMETYDFDVIPKGLVMFVPAFVVLAVRAEANKILLNTQLSLSTRKSMLKELCIIERAFIR